MTHKDLDKEWGKLSKHWKEMALKFVEHEKFIIITRKEVKRLKKKIKEDREKCSRKD